MRKQTTAQNDSVQNLEDSKYPSAVCKTACAVSALQSCLTICNLTDGGLMGSSVRGIFQGRIRKWVAILHSRGLPDSGMEPVSPVCPALAGGSPACARLRAIPSGFYYKGHCTFITERDIT